MANAAACKAVTEHSPAHDNRHECVVEVPFAIHDSADPVSVSAVSIALIQQQQQNSPLDRSAAEQPLLVSVSQPIPKPAEPSPHESPAHVPHLQGSETSGNNFIDDSGELASESGPLSQRVNISKMYSLEPHVMKPRKGEIVKKGPRAQSFSHEKLPTEPGTGEKRKKRGTQFKRKESEERKIPVQGEDDKDNKDEIVHAEPSPVVRPPSVTKLIHLTQMQTHEEAGKSQNTRPNTVLQLKSSSANSHAEEKKTVPLLPLQSLDSSPERSVKPRAQSGVDTVPRTTGQFVPVSGPSGSMREAMQERELHPRAEEDEEEHERMQREVQLVIIKDAARPSPDEDDFSRSVRDVNEG